MLIHKQPTNRCSYVRLLTFILIAFLILISHIVWHNQQANVTQLDIQSGALNYQLWFCLGGNVSKGDFMKVWYIAAKFSNSCTDNAYNISESALLGIDKMCSIGYIAIWSALHGSVAYCRKNSVRAARILHIISLVLHWAVAFILSNNSFEIIISIEYVI